jgi:hypothetical protein
MNSQMLFVMLDTISGYCVTIIRYPLNHVFSFCLCNLKSSPSYGYFTTGSTGLLLSFVEQKQLPFILRSILGN